LGLSFPLPVEVRVLGKAVRKHIAALLVTL
jgi:hypothetical protein